MSTNINNLKLNLGTLSKREENPQAAKSSGDTTTTGVPTRDDWMKYLTEDNLKTIGSMDQYKDDADKFSLARSLANQDLENKISDVPRTDLAMRDLTKHYYQQLGGSDKFNIDYEFGLDNPLAAGLAFADDAMQRVFKPVGDVIDYGFDNTIGNLVESFDKDAGKTVKDFASGEDLTWIPSAAIDAATWFLPGSASIKIPALLAKGAAEFGGNFAQALSGRDMSTGEQLNGWQRTANLAAGGLGTLLGAIPGAGYLKGAERTALKEAAEAGMTEGEKKFMKELAEAESEEAMKKGITSEAGKEASEKAGKEAVENLRNETAEKAEQAAAGVGDDAVRQAIYEAAPPGSPIGKINASTAYENAAKQLRDQASENVLKGLTKETEEAVAKEVGEQAAKQAEEQAATRFDEILNSINARYGRVNALDTAALPSTVYRGEATPNLKAAVSGFGDTLEKIRPRNYISRFFGEEAEAAGGKAAKEAAGEAGEQVAKEATEGAATTAGKEAGKPKGAIRTARDEIGAKLSGAKGNQRIAGNLLGLTNAAIQNSADLGSDSENILSDIFGENGEYGHFLPQALAANVAAGFLPGLRTSKMRGRNRMPLATTYALRGDMLSKALNDIYSGRNAYTIDDLLVLDGLMRGLTMEKAMEEAAEIKENPGGVKPRESSDSDKSEKSEETNESEQKEEEE